MLQNCGRLSGHDFPKGFGASETDAIVATAQADSGKPLFTDCRIAIRAKRPEFVSPALIVASQAARRVMRYLRPAVLFRFAPELQALRGKLHGTGGIDTESGESDRAVDQNLYRCEVKKKLIRVAILRIQFRCPPSPWDFPFGRESRTFSTRRKNTFTAAKSVSRLKQSVMRNSSHPELKAFL